MIHKAISQNNIKEGLQEQPAITWGGALSGDYPVLAGLNQTKIIIWQPSTTNVKTYNHHPFVIEFGGYIHVMHSTTNADEENPGMYVRYVKSDNEFVTQTSYLDLFESQDDITRARNLGGRVCVPAGFAIIDGELYGLTDVNDRGAGTDPRSRTGVGLLARKININGTFETVVWIENADGSFNAPAEIPTYPSYSFDSSLRTKIRNYYSANPHLRSDWYFSTPSTDFLYTEGVFSGDRITEPRVVELPSGQFLKLWRLAILGASTKITQTSDYGFVWSDLYDTGIPDQPSRTMLLQLNTREIVIIGNNDSAARTPLFFALSSDGLTYETANVYNIDTEIGGAVFGGFGKGTGVQYPHSIELSNGRIFTVYSVNKEDIKISTFDKPMI